MPAEVAAIRPAVAGTRGTCGLVLTLRRRRIGYQCPGRPVVRLLQLIDIQLRLPQLRTVLRHHLWERRMVPTKLFRAIRPKSPIGQDASAFPLLRPWPATE